MRSHPKKWHLLIPDAAPRGDSSYIWIPLDSSSRANPGLLGCLKCNKIWIIIDIIYYWYKHAMQSSFWTWCWCPKADPCTYTYITLVSFRIAEGLLVDTVQAGSGQSALAGGQEDGDKRLSSLPRELHLNFRNRTISSSLSTLLEDVNGFELHKHHGQGILL